MPQISTTSPLDTTAKGSSAEGSQSNSDNIPLALYRKALLGRDASNGMGDAFPLDVSVPATSVTSTLKRHPGIPASEWYIKALEDALFAVDNVVDTMPLKTKTRLWGHGLTFDDLLGTNKSVSQSLVDYITERKGKWQQHLEEYVAEAKQDWLDAEMTQPQVFDELQDWLEAQQIQENQDGQTQASSSDPLIAFLMQRDRQGNEDEDESTARTAQSDSAEPGETSETECIVNSDDKDLV